MSIIDDFEAAVGRAEVVSAHDRGAPLTVTVPMRDARELATAYREMERHKAFCDEERREMLKRMATAKV